LVSDDSIRHESTAHVADAATAFWQGGRPKVVDKVTGLEATPVLIVTYANTEDVFACLQSLRGAMHDPALEVFICENGGQQAYEQLAAALTGPDGPCVMSEVDETIVSAQFEQQSLLRLTGWPGAPLVHLAGASENLGYAGGVNAWLRALLAVPGWPAVWVLNPDTQPAPDALAELATYAHRWRKGMIGSRLVPTADRSLVHSRGLAWNKRRAVAMSVDLRASGTFEPSPEQVDRRIDAPSGASMYVTRACINEIGMMDERYFLYFEDLEWGLRAKQHCGVGYAHRSVVLHTGGTTIGGSTRASKRSPLSVYLEARNSILFVREKYPSWVLWTAGLQVLRSLRHAHDYSIRTLRAAISGVFAGMLGRTGRPDWLLPHPFAARRDSK
jgi:N-acetylglucosaminyl-diphospho-decaprenol L-rhamnosyltransferase